MAISYSEIEDMAKRIWATSSDYDTKVLCGLIPDMIARLRNDEVLLAAKPKPNGASK